MSESLRSLSDNEIILRTETLVARERRLTLSVLLHLAEIERRQLHLKRGYGTLFTYCTAGLGYSAGAAMRRIQAARCVAEFPEVQALLEAKLVNLSTVGLVAGILTSENKADVLKRISGKSQREVEAIAAEYDPKAAIPRDRVTTIAVMMPTANFRSGNSGPGSSLSADSDASGAEATQTSGLSGWPGSARLERRAWLQFAADDEFMATLAQVKSIAAHRLPPNFALEDVFRLVMRYFVAREDPKMRETRRAARNAQRQTARKSTIPARHIPAEIRDQVFIRDGGRCTYKSNIGTRCDSTHMLQLDHIVPVARGGASTVENLRLLCAYHNRLEAERIMGRSAPPEDVSAEKQPADARPH